MSQLTQDRGVAGFLTNRRQLIVQVMKLTSAIESGHRDIAEALVHRFCQSLIDYLSNGYFRIYGDLLSCQSWSPLASTRSSRRPLRPPCPLLTATPQRPVRAKHPPGSWLRCEILSPTWRWHWRPASNWKIT
ncbi:MAG: Rsd/AlgQ family anti-sigma factor [Gammaproteobacteria bacterium]|nr:Rsd/AlgQ family anti-sigma factor [Gammaproteobacteria bacterium]